MRPELVPKIFLQTSLNYFIMTTSSLHTELVMRMQDITLEANELKEKQKYKAL